MLSLLARAETPGDRACLFAVLLFGVFFLIVVDFIHLVASNREEFERTPVYSVMPPESGIEEHGNSYCIHIVVCCVLRCEVFVLLSDELAGFGFWKCSCCRSGLSCQSPGSWIMLLLAVMNASCWLSVWQRGSWRCSALVTLAARSRASASTCRALRACGTCALIRMVSCAASVLQAGPSRGFWRPCAKY